MRILLLFALSQLGFLLAGAKDKVGISSQPQWLYPVKINGSLKPDTRNASNGYYLELVDRQLNLTNQTEYVHYIRHVVNEAGVQNGSEVSVNFSPEYQHLVFHQVVVFRNGEAIDKLNAKEIKIVQEETNSDNFQYDGIKRAFIILKDVKKDDRIDVSYSITGFNPIFNNKFSTQLYFWSVNPIVNYFETIIAEPDRRLYLTSFQNAVSPEEKITDGKKIYHWNNPPRVIWSESKGVPSWYNKYSFVSISEYKNWNEVANWGVQLFNNYQHELPASLKKKIEEWKKLAGGDVGSFASNAVRYVQDEIRYLGLEMGVHSHKPHSPKEVFENGFGDCKDKSLLLALILRQADIQAYVALLNTSKRGEMYKTTPSPDEFDHAIVAIKSESGYRYIDPTYSLQRGEFSELYIPDYGYALLLKNDETALRAIEPGFINSTYIVERLKVSASDTSRLYVTTTYKGGRADNIRNYLSEVGMKEIEKSYTDFYSPIFDGIKMVGDVIYEDDTIVNAGTVTEEYVIPELWDKDKKEKKSFNVYARSIYEEFTAPGNMDSVNSPIALKYPSSVFYTLKIEMPGDWGFPKDDLNIKNDSYEFDFQTEVQGRLITLKYFVKTFKDHIPAEEIEQYKKDYKKITDVIEYTLSYNAPGDVQKAIDDNSGPNWITIWFTAILVALLSFVLVNLDKRVVEVEYDRHSGWKIGGWMVVLGISLFLSVGFNTYTLFSSEYLNNANWQIWKGNGAGFLTIIFIELTALLILLTLGIANIYWFLKRRDIFPKMFLWYIGILIGSKIILYILYFNNNVIAADPGLTSDALREITRSVVYGAIWGTYISRSYRAKATFLQSV